MLAEVLTELGATHAILALDQDEAGHAGTLKLMGTLADSFKLSYAEWDAKEGKGLDDLLKGGGSYTILSGGDALDCVAKKTKPEKLTPAQAAGKPSTGKARRIRKRNGTTLLATEFADPGWIVPGLIPTGLTIICAKPKVGKSMAMLDLSVAVSTGTSFLDPAWICPMGNVLYLDMEGTPRGTKKRLLNVIGERELTPGGIDFINSDSDVPRFPAFIPWLEKEWEESGEPRLVIVDVWAKIRPSGDDDKAGGYDANYDAITAIKGFADSKGIGVILVHHLRKNIKEVEDAYDAVLGSTAMAGAVDTIALILKNRQEDTGYFQVVGREVEHTRVPAKLENNRWTACEEEDEPGKKVGRVTAKDWLAGYLSDGEPHLKDDVVKAGESVAKEKSLRDAYGQIPNTVPVRVGSGQKAYWRVKLTGSALAERLTTLRSDLEVATNAEQWEGVAKIKDSIRLLEEV